MKRICIALAAGLAATGSHALELARDGKALCAIARIHGRFGIGMAAKLLRGNKDARLRRSGLHQTPTFGVLKEHSEEWLLKLLRRCVTAGWIDFQGGNRPVVLLTNQGYSTIHSDRSVRFQLPPTGRTAPRLPSPSKSAKPTPHDEAFDEQAQALFEALRHHRLELARAASVPPYVIASDRSLRDIALLRPADLDELQLAHGIGPSKAEKYGEGLLAIVNQV